MKAWIARGGIEPYATVVFAETRGKARSLATHTEACEDVSFLDIEVRRCEAADKYYQDGKWEMDWYKKEDRIALVRDCGFQCAIDTFEPEECQHCPASQWCDLHQDYIREKVEANVDGDKQ